MKRTESIALGALGLAGLALAFMSKKPTTTGEPTMHGTIPTPLAADHAARQRVIDYAASQLGSNDPRPYWIDSYGFIPAPLEHYAWCGVFALWCLRQARLTDRRWKAGIGFIFVDDHGKIAKTPWLRIVDIKNGELPAIGDVVYFDQPYQHYALVESVEADGVHIIAGNTPNVSRSRTTLTKPTAFFSIASLLPSAQV